MVSVAHAQSLIVTGFSLGMLHVLAGPDHLSALAVLSVGNSWKAMSLGLRWGLGHSSGDSRVMFFFNLKCFAVFLIIFVGLKDLSLLRQFSLL